MEDLKEGHANPTTVGRCSLQGLINSGRQCPKTSSTISMNVIMVLNSTRR